MRNHGFDGCFYQMGVARIAHFHSTDRSTGARDRVETDARVVRLSLICQAMGIEYTRQTVSVSLGRIDHTVECVRNAPIVSYYKKKGRDRPGSIRAVTAVDKHFMWRVAFGHCQDCLGVPKGITDWDREVGDTRSPECLGGAFCGPDSAQHGTDTEVLKLWDIVWSNQRT